jgi:hypothetical protein
MPQGVAIYRRNFTGRISTSPPAAQTYREQARSLREKAAGTTSRDIRTDMENIALQYELTAESVEKVRKKRRG